MTCREVVDALGAYVDGELSPEIRGRFDGHVAACPRCAAYLQTYRDTSQLAKGAGRDPAPADLPEDLAQAILTARRKSLA